MQTIQNDRDSDTSDKDFKIAVIIILKDLKENMKTIRWEMDDIRKKSKWSHLIEDYYQKKSVNLKRYRNCPNWRI